MDPVYFAVAQTSEGVTTAICRELPCARIELLQAKTEGPEPKVVLRVLSQSPIDLFASICIGFERCKTIRPCIETIEPIPGCSPQRSIMTDQQPMDDVVTQRRRIALFVPVTLPPSTLGVETKQSIVGCADPDQSSTIFNDAEYIERDAGIHGRKCGSFSRRIDTD